MTRSQPSPDESPDTFRLPTDLWRSGRIYHDLSGAGSDFQDLRYTNFEPGPWEKGWQVRRADLSSRLADLVEAFDTRAATLVATGNLIRG